MADKIQFRRDTAARWASVNPILLIGEMGLVTDNPNQYKIGDGINYWNDLPLRGYNGTLVDIPGTASDAAMSQKGATDLTSEYNVSANNSNTEYTFAQAVALVPVSLQKGGITIKYIDSTTHEYVVKRLMSSTWNTTESNWQGIDSEPVAGSDNLVKSGGVYNEITSVIGGEIGVNFINDSTLWYGGVGSTITKTSTGYASNERMISYLSVKEGQNYIITISIDGSNSTIILTDSNNLVVYTKTGNVSNLELTIPTGATRMYINRKSGATFKFTCIGKVEDYTTFATGEKVKEVSIDSDLNISSNNLVNNKTITREFINIEGGESVVEFTNDSKLWNGSMGSVIGQDSTGFPDNERSNSYINVKEGQKYKVTANTSGTNNIIILTDSENIVTYKKSGSLSNFELTIPSGSTRMYLNKSSQYTFKLISNGELERVTTFKSGQIVKDISIDEELDTTSNNLVKNKVVAKEFVDIVGGNVEVVFSSGYWGNSGGKVVLNASGMNEASTTYIKVAEGYVFTAIVSVANVPKVEFADDEDNYISSISATGSTNNFVVPQGATRMYLNKALGYTGFKLTFKGRLNILEENVKNLNNTVENQASELEGLNRKIGDYTIHVDYNNANSYWGGSIGSTISRTSSGYANYSSDSYVSLLGVSRIYLQLTVLGQPYNAIFTDDNDIIISRIYSIPTADGIFDVPSGATRLYTTTSSPETAVVKLLGIYEDVKLLMQEEAIYAPYAQQPADGTSTSNFDAENITPSELYDAFDDLISKSQSVVNYPKYIKEYYKVGRAECSESDTGDNFDIKAYVLSEVDRFAFKATEKLYCWIDENDNTVYIDSCSPRIGDTIYSDAQRTSSGKTVSSYDSSTDSFLSSDSIAYTRHSEGNIKADIIYSLTISNSGSVSLLNEKNNIIGNGIWVDYTHISYNSKTYTRCDSLDYNTKSKGTIVLWANEHGAQSDPYEGSITLYNLARDLSLGNFRNNKFLRFLKEYVRVVLIPIANPYSMYYYALNKRPGRNNYNNVNLNRNYDCPGWSHQSDNDKGNYAGDQNETQYIMNTCLEVGANLCIDIHCLGYNSSISNEGKTHYAGYIPSATANEKVASIMKNYGFSYSSYGGTNPQTHAEGSDWIYYNGMAGGLIEMNAGKYAVDFNGNQHSALILEADYSLLLNTVRMWWYGYDATLNIGDLII